MDINWDAVGAIGEILGALAVFVSLIYLAVQIRNQTRESRLLASHDVATALRDLNKSVCEPHLIGIIGKLGQGGIDTLESYEERAQFGLIMSNAYRFWEDAYIQFQEGRLDTRVWHSVESHSRMVPHSTVGGQEYWASRKGQFSHDFREYVDALPPSEFVGGQFDRK